MATILRNACSARSRSPLRRAVSPAMNSSSGFELACAEPRPEPVLAVSDDCADASCDPHNAAKLVARKKHATKRLTSLPVDASFRNVVVSASTSRNSSSRCTCSFVRERTLLRSACDPPQAERIWVARPWIICPLAVRYRLKESSLPSASREDESRSPHPCRRSHG